MPALDQAIIGGYMGLIIDPSMVEAYENWCNTDPTDYEREIMARYKDDIFMSFNAGWIAAKEFIRQTNNGVQQQVRSGQQGACMPYIRYMYSGESQGYHVSMDGEQIFFTKDAYQRDMFIAELKGKLRIAAEQANQPDSSES
jgi:hypothetical protein